MGCSVTSVLSSRRRRGAEPPAVAAAAIEKTLRRRCSRLLRQQQAFEWSNSLQRCGGRPLWLLIGHLQHQHGGLHEEDEEQCDRWSGLQFQQVCFFISESTENRGGAGPGHLQDRRHHSVLLHQDSDPDSLDWWRHLRFSRDRVVHIPVCCKVRRLVSAAGLLSRSFRIFRIVPESRVSVGQKIHAWSSSNGHLLGKPRKSPAGWRSRKFARTTRPPTQMQPQAQTARTQHLSATRMSTCFRNDLECRDVDASATGFGPRPLDSGHQVKSEICNQRADKPSDHEDHEVRR